MDLKQTILIYALQNALKFNGKANQGAVIGKVLSENNDLDPKKIAKQISLIIKQVNKLSIKQQQAKLEKLAPNISKEKKPVEKEHVLKELRNAEKGKVIMRFAPSPSGPMHLGHAYGISLSSEYCKKYNGKFILRIEDTNPENIYEPAYNMLQEDAKWITKNNISRVIIQSDRLGYYYDYAEKLINFGKAYVCTCNPDDFKKQYIEYILTDSKDIKNSIHHINYLDIIFLNY